MADEQESKIVISVDKTAANDSIKAIKALDDAHKQLGQSVNKLDKPLEDSAATLKKVNKESQSAASSMKAVADAASGQMSEVKTATSAIEAYEASLRSVKQSGADLSGDLAGSLGGLRGAAGAVGLGGATSPAFDIAQSFADLGEFAPKLKVQLEGVGAALSAGASVASTFAGNAGTAIAGFTGISASLGTVLAVAAPVALAIGGVALAFKNFQDQAQKQADQLNAIIDARRQVGQDVAGGLTTEQAQAQITALERQRQAEQDLLVAQQTAYDSAIAQLGLLGGLAQQIAPQEQALADQIQASKDAIAGYDSSIAALSSQLDSGAIAANDTAVAESELAKTREQEAQAAIQQAEQSAARVAQLNQQISDLNTNRAIQESNAAQTNALERKFAQQDEKAETAAHFQALADITAQGQAKIEAIQGELNQLPIQQAQALAEIQAQGNEKLKATQDEYFKSQIEATQDFAKSQSRIASDTAKAAKRLAEDIADNLADAARSNDVVAFLKIQRDGQKDLRRNAEDAKESEKRATEDFIQAQEKERQAFNEKQAATLKGIADEKAKQLQAFAEKKQALEAQIQQERANTQAAIANAQARYQASEAQEAQAAARDAQRLALRQQQEEAAYQRQIAAIQSRINSENSLYSTISAGLSRVTAQAAALGASKTATSGKSSYFGSSSSGSISYKSPYEKGGFSKSSGGTTLNISMNNTIGDIATASQVSAAFDQYHEAAVKMFTGGISGAQS